SDLLSYLGLDIVHGVFLHLIMIEINLRGTKFSTSSSSVQNILEKLSMCGRAEILADGSYYLDRNPLIFHHILDFYTEGEFHLPRNICPLQARKEMEFWVIPFSEIPVCCYETLYDDKEAEYKAIGLLENEVRHQMDDYNVIKSKSPKSSVRDKLLYALNFPLQSLLGKIWLFVVAIVTAASIAVFLLESSAYFRVQRMGQPTNKTIQLAGNNQKFYKLLVTKTAKEMAFAEIFSNTVLTFDLILRFIISPMKKQFCKRPQNILELLTELVIFTFVALEYLVDYEKYINNFSYVFSTLMQIFYSLRVFRIFRIIESCSEMKMLKLSLQKSLNEFCLFVTVLITFAFIFGSWMFWAEFYNPETFPNIFFGIWWVIVTMTTVGYGDFFPKTTAGYFVGVLTSIFGLILLAMPIATIASNFSKIYDCYNFRKTHIKTKQVKHSKQISKEPTETRAL
ncbi:potassium voltage-gated channel subfamily C member 3-like, partial [Saccostrea cucullata]|uniref:potassium voltage-gated channel subfamily C member 3-like n=1 Tax=Saccostrea cuccullata TaxID=36930 RepID=UPI002ED68727